MGRALLLAAMIYGAGFSAFDDLRPAALAKPLKSFHRAVDDAVSDGRRATQTLDDARRMRYLKVLIDRWPSGF